MPQDIVYFDLETQRTANDAGGWDRKRDMGMSIGVTYSTGLGEYRIYQEREVDQLIEQLRRADCVVGYNVINFDYEVLFVTSVPSLHRRHSSNGRIHRAIPRTQAPNLVEVFR